MCLCWKSGQIFFSSTPPWGRQAQSFPNMGNSNYICHFFSSKRLKLEAFLCKRKEWVNWKALAEVIKSWGAGLETGIRICLETTQSRNQGLGTMPVPQRPNCWAPQSPEHTFIFGPRKGTASSKPCWRPESPWVPHKSVPLGSSPSSCGLGKANCFI